MEFNVKNCLGPSHGSIEEAFTLQCAWYDDHVAVVDDAYFGFTPPDYKGPTTIYQGATEEEAKWVERRLNQLEDLMRLRKPVTLDDCYGGMTCDWTGDEIARFEEWNARGSDDPMGDHHGRNV